MRLAYRILSVFLVTGILFSLTRASQAASFDSSNLISDGEFINANDMSVGEISRFLNDKNSFLKDFSENGRSSADIAILT